MTENCAVATTNRPGRNKVGTVGEPYPDIGFRLDETTGEIQPNTQRTSLVTGTSLRKRLRPLPPMVG